MNIPGLRAGAVRLVDHPNFALTIMALIGINAVILGLQTSDRVTVAVGPALEALDAAILAIFVFELLARLVARGRAFFRDPWSLFDATVVGLALLPTSDSFAVLRTLRVLRMLRLASAVPRMRRVVEALLSSLPGLGAVVSILLLIFYVAGVMATELFGQAFPQWFGTLPRSIYSLFQIMTLESWSMGIVRPVMALYPYAWGFFVPFILIATFTMLNLFIAVVVNAMQRGYHEQEAEQAELAHSEREAMLSAIVQLQREVAGLREALGAGAESGNGSNGDTSAR